MDSATNELPLTAINFSLNPVTPDSILHEPHDYLLNFNLLRMSPLATNERPLSCTCLPQVINAEPILGRVVSSFGGVPSRPVRLTKIYKTEKMRRNSWSAEYLMQMGNNGSFRPVVLAPILCQTLSSDHLFDDLVYLRTSPDFQLATKCTLPNKSPPNRNDTTTYSDCIPPIQIFDFDPIETKIPAVTCSSFATYTSNTPTTTSSTNFVNPTIPHPTNIVKHNPDTTSSSSSQSSTVRRQRHSIAGQMSYFKMLGFGGFSKKMATSTNSLFSTAVISGSSSAPNLRDMIPNTASPSGKFSNIFDGFSSYSSCSPSITPLKHPSIETLTNQTKF